MNTIQNTYNQISHSWHERMRLSSRIGQNSHHFVGELSMPNWMVNGPILAFIVAFVICSVTFGYGMPIELASYAILSVLLFFLGTKLLSIQWRQLSNQHFAKKLFIGALGIRLIWAVLSYMFFNQFTYGKVDGYGDDNGWYLEFAQITAKWIQDEDRIPFSELTKEIAVDDTGYPVWLAILYILSFESSDVFIPLIAKAVLGAYCCLCIYRIALRHFGEGTARLAGLFMCLNPNMLFWGACLLKETEMVFLCCLYLDKTDEVLSSGKKMTFKGLMPGVIAAFALFFFRSALGVVAFLAILAHVVFASHRVMKVGKKVLAGILVGIVLLVGVGDRLRIQSNALIEQVRSDQQKTNMEWRATRVDEGGRTQAFAKYAGAAVFAPLIFTIPFPTFNMANNAQIAQAQLSGGNYIKNIFSFFVIFVMISLLMSGEWRRHVFILAYTLGYHMVLVMSNFAQSGRFHMPVLPMLMLFAAYGIQLLKTNPKLRRWFSIALVVEVLACLVWNWFKLAGRGMV